MNDTLMINFQLSQRNLIGLTLLVLAIMLMTLAYVGWEWCQDWKIAHREIAPAQVAFNKSDNKNLIDGIASAHIFGKAPPALGAVPLSNLQFKLTGIAKEAKSKAYISISGQTSKIYSVGDKLPYGVKIYEITSDAVILENDGQLEKLPLARNKLEFKERGLTHLGA